MECPEWIQQGQTNQIQKSKQIKCSPNISIHNAYAYCSLMPMPLLMPIMFISNRKNSLKSNTFISFGKRKSNWNFIYKWCICSTFFQLLCVCVSVWEWIKLSFESFCICRVQQLVHAKRILQMCKFARLSAYNLVYKLIPKSAN